tara:strand:+ start:44 stop:265 length:222 start_codon:yes stop_codon:yes gene_type:complete
MVKEFTVFDETVQDVEDFIYESFYDYDRVFGYIEIFENTEGGVVIEIHTNKLGADLYSLFYNAGFEVVADKDY